MAYKTYRELKVYESSGKNYKPTPQIRLQGDWLKDCEFDIGTPITVKCEGGRLVITKSDEIVAEECNYSC